MVPDKASIFGPRAAVDAALLAAVAESFGLGPVGETQDLGGTYNLNLQAQTAAGTFVIRVYRPWIGWERLQTVQRVRSHLARAGIPALPPLMTRDGATILRWEDRLIEVEPFVPHDPVTFTWDRYGEAFSLLGTLHDALVPLAGSITAHPPLVSNYGTPRQLLDWTRRAEVRTRESIHRRATEALRLCALAGELLTVMEDQWRAIGRHLYRQPIHGDYGPGNVLFDGPRPVAILDFDFLAVRERVYDLAYTLYWMLRRLYPDTSPAELPWPRLREMLDRYQSTIQHPLTPPELAVLPCELARVPLYWVGEAAFLPDPAEAILAAAPGMELARWVIAQGPDLAKLVV